MDQAGEPRAETYNPWSIVSLVFGHLAAQGLHPVLGQPGDPGGPAAELLRCLGIQPEPEGSRQVSEHVSDQLAQLRNVFFGGE